MSKLSRWTRNAIAGLAMTLGTMLPAHGQDYSISGKVRSLERITGNPIENVRIDVDSSSYMAKTDALGNFVLNNIPSGIHNIRMSADGYIGIFKQNYVLDNNKILNVSLANTMQESPSGELALKLDQFKTQPPWIPAYVGLNSVEPGYENSQTWKDITEGNLIPIRLLNANIADSANFIDATGICDGDGIWSDSPVNSIEYKQKRELYKLTNDVGIDGKTKRGILVKFHSDGNYTIARNDTQNNNYILAAVVNLSTNMKTTIQKEVFGRAFNRADVFGRLSYMNGSSGGVTDLDHMLNIVFFNQWAALARGEQQSNILDMENSPVIGAPVSTEFIQPINNSTGLETTLQFIWKNKFGTDKYQLEIATDAGYTNKVLSKEVTRIDTTIVLDANTQYFGRIQTKNKNGTSSWYNITFRTGTITGFEDVISYGNIRLFPNPAEDELTLEYFLSQPSNINICIYTMTGQKLTCLTSKEFTGKKTHTINLSTLEPGAFILKVESTSLGQPRQLKSFKFFKN